MNNINKQAPKDRLEFNTYCFFTEEDKDISQTIELIFKDYIKSLNIDDYG